MVAALLRRRASYGLPRLRSWGAALLIGLHLGAAHADTRQTLVDLPTRPGVTLRMAVLTPPEPRAAVILLAGGHGGLQLGSNGEPAWGGNNFVVRIRHQLADRGLTVLLLDAPSDRPAPAYLAGWRQTPEHAQDVAAAIAWARQQAPVPVWLLGTSRGTQSAAFVATELPRATGPDGLILTATILTDPKGRAVPKMPLDRLAIPVLVLHHEDDGCTHCAAGELPTLMTRLGHLPRHDLRLLKGGINRGDPCEAAAYHGFNGLDTPAATLIADWILSSPR